MKAPTNGKSSPLVVGVTGGIASGKSTVLEELRRLGAEVFSADEIAREIVQPGEPAYQPVVEAFGPEIVDEEGRIDRGALGALVFHDETARQRLEALMHPIILHRLRTDLEAFRNQPPNDPPVAAAEIPLLYEVGAQSMVDTVLVVTVEQEQQFQRLKERTGWPEEQIWAAIQSQLPLSQKRERADWVLSTDGTLEETRAQVRAFWEKITKTFKLASG